MIRALLLLEAIVFFAAALVHGGHLLPGYEHGQARIAESVIGLVLLAGLGAVSARPARARSIGLAAQGFALLGTLVGAFTIAVGVGPGTGLDIAYHALLLVLLAGGLALTARRGR